MWYGEWTPEKATELVKPIKDIIWEAGYHISVGGGVLWRGASTKDLDLFILPLFSPTERPYKSPYFILGILTQMWKVEPIPFTSSLGEDATSADYLGWTTGQFDIPTGRVDVFICPPPNQV